MNVLSVFSISSHKRPAGARCIEVAGINFSLLILTMLNSLVGWVRLTKSGLLARNLVSLPDYVWIAQCLNPTPDLAL
jgi:hypothetical protein